MTSVSELNSSELGTREFWNSRYEKDIENYHDHGDTGEVWFGDQCRFRILKWIEKCSEISKTSSIIDIGCGSGLLLNDLASKGFVHLTGIDYSEPGIRLAKEIALNKKLSIDFKTIDILNPDDMKTLETYDVLHDNGTYDAVSLNPDNATEKKEMYVTNAAHIIRQNGLLIVTSCNWTEDELKKQFSTQFSVYDAIPSPVFSFGGKTGSPYTTIIFKKT